MRSAPDPESVVILRDDHLGDMILTTPLARSLHKAGFNVTVVGKQIWAPVWQDNPNARFVSLESLSPAYPRKPWKLVSWLRQQKFDHLLVPYHSVPLFTISMLSGARHRYAQFGKIAARLTAHHCFRSGLDERMRHFADIWLDLARHLDCPDFDPHPELRVSHGTRVEVGRKIESNLPAGGSLVVVHPFHGKSSCHPHANVYREVIRLLLENPQYRVILTGSADDGRKWNDDGENPRSPHFWNSCGQLTLPEFFGVIEAADGLVCGSTGALHISSALACPSVSIFCPHPDVGPGLWSSFTPGSRILTAPESACLRKKGCPVDCGMTQGPDAASIYRKIHGMLEETQTGG